MAAVFITGATGQDGSYLCEELLMQGYDVHALAHGLNAVPPGLSYVDEVTWHEGDLGDSASITALINDIAPAYIYNLAGITSVALSWQEPLLTGAITGMGALAIFDAALKVQEQRGTAVQVLQASSAEIFGSPEVSPQTELTSIRPMSPYGAAKAFAHHLAAVYRGHGLAVSTAILYNHESPRRPTGFVTRKITRTVAEISMGRADSLVLGNLDARRDWGWAPDYTHAMRLATEHPDADDYVVATGQAHSVRDFVVAAFEHVGITDVDKYVTTDPAFMRPADPVELVGDASHAREKLGWAPTVDFESLVHRMVQADLDELSG